MDPQIEDELTLNEFKQQVIQLNRFFNMVISFFIKGAKKYAVWMIVLFVMVTAAMYYLYSAPKTFKAKSSYTYVILEKKLYGEMMDKLGDMIRSHSYNQASKALDMPLDQIKNIVDIRAENIYGAPLSEDLSPKPNILYVTVKALNNLVFNDLEHHIESYLNNNTGVQEMIPRMRQQILYKKMELARLDSLEAAYTQNLDKLSVPAPTAGNPFNPVLIYEKGEKLNKEIVDMQALLLDNRAVQTQDKFMAGQYPDQRSLLWYLLVGLALFAGGAVLLIFCFSICKK